jgi:DNA-binding MarR family transcriptional regulator
LDKSWASLVKSASKDLSRQSEIWQIELYLAIIRVTDSLDALVHKKIQGYGMNRSNLALLYHLIANEGEMTQTELAKAVSRTKQAIGLSLRNLEKHGLVSRRRVPKDNRMKMVKITEKGLQIASEILPMRKEIFIKALSCFSESQSKKTVKGLYKIRGKILAELEEL